MKLPKAKTENIVEQSLGKELVIYDLLSDKAFNLNESLSIIYKNCDGETSFEKLKRIYKYTNDFICFALDELQRNNLLNDVYESPFAKISRREAIKRVGLASMIALPMIVGLSAPQAANAASDTCRTNVCYPAGFALCNACPRTVNITLFNSENGSCVTQTVTANDNCYSGRYTIRDARVNSV